MNMIKLVFLICSVYLFANYSYSHITSCIYSPIARNKKTGKIEIPKHIKHIKLDIGLSYSAPMSQYWLTHEKDLLVFGFEPNPESVRSIINGALKIHPTHGTPLDKKFIGTNFFLINCALGQATSPTIPFYITAGDQGCSSLHKPHVFQTDRIITVPYFRLSDFFDIFPFNTHPIIEYIKIDAQGADLDIVKSGGDYLTKHVVFITLEAENGQYENTVNSIAEIEEYMKKIDFVRDFSQNTQDPTYINTRFAAYVKTHEILIYQQG
jgi:FkbM family methyltransferase